MSASPGTRTERGWRYTFGPGALRDVVVTVELEGEGLVVAVSGQAEIVHPDGTLDTITVDGHRTLFDERSGDNTMRRVMARIGRTWTRPTPLTTAMRAFHGDAEVALHIARSMTSDSVATQLTPTRLSDEPALDFSDPDDPF